MAVQSITKQPISPVDIQMDTAGGESVTNFTRATSTGGTESVASLSAAQIPVLDAPVVTSARAPFAVITTATDRDIEQCLQTARINMRDMKNFEHYGGLAGSGISDTQAERNVEVWRKILDDINSEGRNNGIFFPGARYEFKDNNGLGGLYATHTLPFETSGAVNVGNIVIAGTRATTLAAHTNADGNDLFHSVDVSNIVFLDVNIEQTTGATGSCYESNASTTAVTNLIFDNVGWTEGDKHINVEGSSGTLGVWVTRCTHNAADTYSIRTLETGIVNIMNNRFPGANTGIEVAAATTTSLAGSRIQNNIMTDTTVDNSIVVTRTGSYSATAHRDVDISGNSLSRGNINSIGMNEVNASRNRLLDGAIILNFTTMSGTVGLSNVTDNEVAAGSNTSEVYGINIRANGQDIERCRVSGGSVVGFDNAGVLIEGTSGIASLMRVQGVSILNCSQAGDGTGTGIEILSADASGGTQFSLFSGNIIRSTNGSLRHEFGIREDTTSTLNAGNRFHGNLIKGYSGGAATQIHTGGTPASAEADTFDLGAAV